MLRMIENYNIEFMGEAKDTNAGEIYELIRITEFHENKQVGAKSFYVAGEKDEIDVQMSKNTIENMMRKPEFTRFKVSDLAMSA